MNQESMPGPVAMASHTCSGVAASSTSLRSSKWCPMSVLLVCGAVVGVGARVQGDHHPVVAAVGGVLVVVLADQGRDGGRQLLGEGRPVARRGEPDGAVD